MEWILTSTVVWCQGLRTSHEQSILGSVPCESLHIENCGRRLVLRWREVGGLILSGPVTTKSAVFLWPMRVKLVWKVYGFWHSPGIIISLIMLASYNSAWRGLPFHSCDMALNVSATLWPQCNCSGGRFLQITMK